MQLTTENGEEIERPSGAQLENALARIGLPGNGFVILSKSDRCYIQAAGSRADGFIIEYREPNEAEHHSSKRSDISYRDMVNVFTAYHRGDDWKNLVEWAAGLLSTEKMNSRSAARRTLRFVVLLFLCIGVCFISIGGYLAFNTQQFLARAEEVPGTVIRLEERNLRTYAPVVKYEDLSGRTYTLHSTGSSRQPLFYEGQKIKVVYDPADPDFPLSAKLKTFGELWGGAIFAVVFGGAFAGIAGAALLVLRRR